ncbi:hypothetical protein PTKIN_Ptkin03bG0104200 [Pterospermum kingtungense]
MSKVVSSLSEPFIDNVKEKESTEAITMKGKAKAESSKCKESQTGEGVPIGNGQIDVDTMQKEDNKNRNTPMNRERGSRRWFTGRIVAFDNNNRLLSILYEDGDEEVLDLRKERFELDVMPADHFKLESKPCSARKTDELDAGNAREDVMKDDSRNISGAKTMTKISESKRKKGSK